MIRILLCCGGGFSSSAIATRMEKEIKEKRKITIKRHGSLGAVYIHTPILTIKNAKNICVIFRDFQKNKEPKKAYNI